jgi:TolB protein
MRKHLTKLTLTARTRASMTALLAAAHLTGVGGAALPAQGQQQPSEVDVVIGGGTVRAPRYAVPDFVALTPDAAEDGRTLGEVLWDDFAFEREFDLIPRDVYRTIPVARSAQQVPLNLWRELGAEGLVYGTVQHTGDTLRVDVWLFEVGSGRTVFTRGYDGPASNPRRLAHTIADAIHLQQRNGLRGVARTKLAFVSDRNRESLLGTVEKREVKEIYIADYDGANPHRITVSRTLNLNPSWSPDARALAYTSYSASSADLVVSRIYDGILQRPAKGGGNNYLPAFSPDGRRIAFMSTRDGNAEIYVMNVDGSNLRRLTNHPRDDVSPTWSPSGQQIAFVSDRSGRPQVYVMNVDTAPDVQRLTLNETEADRPTWSPAPFNEIAFTARTGSWYDIKVIDMATRQVRQITDGRGSNESPAFSPTGRHLAFTSTRTGNKQIFLIGRDGQGLKQITREGNNQTPAWSSN